LSCVDWPAIFAGAIVAVAVSFIAATFDPAIGLSATSPYKGLQPVVFYVALGLWMTFVAVSSFAAGGYITARLRRISEGASEHERDVRDSVRGSVVWTLAAAAWAATRLGGRHRDENIDLGHLERLHRRER